MNKRLRKWGVFMESEEKNIYTEEKKVYTIEDIARELGVSKTTVSRAISGKGRIGQATRARVLQFIEEHDYRPNVMARGLAQKKTYNLALLLPKDYAATEFPFFKDCMNGICEVASSYDYSYFYDRRGRSVTDTASGGEPEGGRNDRQPCGGEFESAEISEKL